VPRTHRSQQVLEWQQEARLETRRKSVLRALLLRFHGVPEGVKAAVAGMTDPGALLGWLEVAVTADSLAAFLASVQLPPTNGPTS
jgi:hypothetical protein